MLQNFVQRCGVAQRTVTPVVASGLSASSSSNNKAANRALHAAQRNALSTPSPRPLAPAALTRRVGSTNGSARRSVAAAAGGEGGLAIDLTGVCVHPLHPFLCVLMTRLSK